MARINLKEFQDKQLGSENAIHIETPGETFTIPPPALWSDEVLELAETDNLAMTKALIGGEEVYARFKAAGGSQAVVGAILAEVMGVPLGQLSRSAAKSRSTPKR